MTDEQFNPQDEEIEIEAMGVEVSCQPIELYKVLKIANAISGGGEAKHVISEGYVFVNGEVETRKRRKIYDGDLIEFNQEFYVVICDAPVSEGEPDVAEPAAPVVSAPEKLPKSQKSAPAKPKSNKKTSSAAQSKQPKRNDSRSAQKKSKDDKKQPQEEPSSSGRSAIRFF